MDKNKNVFFIQDLSAGIVFGSIFQTSEAAEKVECFFLQNLRDPNIEFWDYCTTMDFNNKIEVDSGLAFRHQAELPKTL